MTVLTEAQIAERATKFAGLPIKAAISTTRSLLQLAFIDTEAGTAKVVDIPLTGNELESPIDDFAPRYIEPAAALLVHCIKKMKAPT